MCKKFLVLLVSVVAFASAANADVMLTIETSLDDPATDYQTTTVWVTSDSDGEKIKGIKGEFVIVQDESGSIGSFEQVLNYGLWYGFRPSGSWVDNNTVDPAMDTHFLFASASVEGWAHDGYYNSKETLYGDFTVWDDSLISCHMPIAQLVTKKDDTKKDDTLIDYDLELTDADGQTHTFTGSFVTPEPASMVVLMLGGLGLAVRRRR
ncbi:MAG: PEP-CTERM sorting domain-containing protein [Phycisphaerae bacterium]